MKEDTLDPVRVAAQYSWVEPVASEEEKAQFTEEVIKHMEEKFITNRTSDAFKGRLAALYPVLADAEVPMGTKYRTLTRWVGGSHEVPDIAWRLLESLEELRRLRRLVADVQGLADRTRRSDSRRPIRTSMYHDLVHDIAEALERVNVTPRRY